MRHAVALLVWLGLILCGGIPVHAQDSGGMVLAVRHAVEAAGDRISIELNGAHLPNIFMIKGDNPRLVLDFADCGYRGRSPEVAPGSRLVKGIRVGRHEVPQRKIRLVLDLIPGRSVAWQREFLSDTKVLELVLRGETPEQRSSVASELSVEVSPADTVADDPLQSPAPQAEPVVLRARPVKIPVAGRETVPESAETAETAESPLSTADQDEPPASAEPSAEMVAKEAPVADTAAASPPAVPAPVLKSISFDNAFSQSGEMVLLQLNAFQPPVITTQEKNPPRIFCDFDGASVDAGVAPELAANGRYVQAVRVESEAQRIRVVLDLVPGANYDLQQVYFKEDNLFVLIVNLMKEAGQ